MFVPTNFIMDTIIQSTLTPAKRRINRHHPLSFKRELVEQSLTNGVSVSRIARAHNINANQLFAWRKMYNDGVLDAVSEQPCKLLPVVLIPLTTQSSPVSHQTITAAPAGVIELAVGKAQLRLEGRVDGATLALVLEHLLR